MVFGYNIKKLGEEGDGKEARKKRVGVTAVSIKKIIIINKKKTQRQREKVNR